MRLNNLGKVIIALEDMGIETILQLLEKCQNPAELREFVKVIAITDIDLKKLGRTANLIQIEGIGEKELKLLEAVSVFTVRDLSTMNAKTLHKKLERCGEGKSINIPSEEEIVKWIEQAKVLNH